MLLARSASRLLAAITLSLGTVSLAAAADLPTKAPVPVVGASVPLDVHGGFDFTLASNRVTGGGLLLYPNRGVLDQVNVGLGLDVYKDPTGFINLVTVYGGVWNEFWSDPPPGGRVWQEMDWWVGVSTVFAKYWKFDVQHVQFNFPNGIPTAYNYVFTLGYDDSGWGLPFTFNPYVSLFYNAAGGSTVVLGKTGNTYRVTLGVVPTVNMKPIGIPQLTFFFPTSVVVGPSDFWNRNDGTTNLCGTPQTLPCALSNVGFVTTGIQGKYDLTGIIPKRLGNWYVKAAGHYYHITNDALLAAQTPFGTGAVASFADVKRDIFIATSSVGFSF